jgi:hypothetical protein
MICAVKERGEGGRELILHFFLTLARLVVQWYKMELQAGEREM